MIAKQRERYRRQWITSYTFGINLANGTLYQLYGRPEVTTPDNSPPEKPPPGGEILPALSF